MNEEEILEYLLEAFPGIEKRRVETDISKVLETGLDFVEVGGLLSERYMGMDGGYPREGDSKPGHRFSCDVCGWFILFF
jgi:hypothetical protein